MNPRYVAFLALTVLSVFFLVPTRDAGMAASAALTAIDVLPNASAPVVDSVESRPAQSDKSEPIASPTKRDVLAPRASAPAGTRAATRKISDAKRKLPAANVRPQVAAESAARDGNGVGPKPLGFGAVPAEDIPEFDKGVVGAGFSATNQIEAEGPIVA